MAWALWIAAYSIAGSIFLIMYGQFLFFNYPEWQIYGGIGLTVGLTAIISIVALSNRSYTWTRVAKTLWPVMIVISAIRAIAMIVELRRGKENIVWECNNGGQLWPGAAASDGSTPTTTIPNGLCGTALNAAFIIALVIDLFCQIYMYFLAWRFSKRLEHYAGMKGPFHGGYYNA